MQELLCSIHNYTKFSGGTSSFYDMAQEALASGLDAVFTTDRNILPLGHNQFYFRDRQRVLFLCGEELFDPLSDDAPRYLSLGIDNEQFNRNIANAYDEIRILLPQEEIPEDSGIPFRHFEIINAQELLRKGIDAGLETIRKRMNSFENLLLNDFRSTALAGTCDTPSPDYTYRELFSTACNHVFVEEQLSGDLIQDKLMILKALKKGNLFIAIDGLSDAKGFRFSAEGNDPSGITLPGDTIILKNSITLKINIPEACLCRLIHNGKIIKEWKQCRQVPYTIYEPGYYRVECALTRKRRLFDWIFTNPIYVRRG